jgi:DNA-binding MarR family transcriptional regulator
MASLIPKSRAAEQQMRALADFRYTLRRFLHFSEEAALRVGLTPQQHQLMLQIAGAPEGSATVIEYLAERLSLRHNSVVELSKRCEEAGLVARRTNPENRRQVVLTLTAAGVRMLEKLSADHWCELHEMAPQMLQTLKMWTES